MKKFQKPFLEKLELALDVISTSDCMGFVPGENELPIDVNMTRPTTGGYNQ